MRSVLALSSSVAIAILVVSISAAQPPAGAVALQAGLSSPAFEIAAWCWPLVQLVPSRLAQAALLQDCELLGELSQIRLLEIQVRPVPHPLLLMNWPVDAS